MNGVAYIRLFIATKKIKMKRISFITLCLILQTTSFGQLYIEYDGIFIGKDTVDEKLMLIFYTKDVFGNQGHTSCFIPPNKEVNIKDKNNESIFYQDTRTLFSGEDLIYDAELLDPFVGTKVRVFQNSTTMYASESKDVFNLEYMSKNVGNCGDITFIEKSRTTPFPNIDKTKFNKFISPDKKFQLNIPSDCDILDKEYSSRKTIFFSSPKKGNFIHLKDMIQVFRIEDKKSIDEMFNEYSKSRKKINQGTENLNGIVTKWLLWETELSNISIKRKTYFLKKGNSKFILICDSTKRTYDLYKPFFDRIIKSFKVN